MEAAIASTPHSAVLTRFAELQQRAQAYMLNLFVFLGTRSVPRREALKPVRTFLAQQGHRLSGLTVREAGKHL